MDDPLHGAQGSGASIRENLRMDEAARRRSMAAVYPDGLGSWACGLGTYADRGSVNDVAFVRTLIQHLGRHLTLDRNRVYVVGFSDGASMAYRLGCQLTNELAAVAGISSGIPAFSQYFGAPSRPLPVVMIAGSRDEIFSAESIAATADESARLDECRARGHEDVSALAADAHAITLTTHRDCSAGVGVSLWLVDGAPRTLRPGYSVT